MGKLVKNHWARLVVMTAATYQVAAALEGYFWPKVFWDFYTKNLDGAVKPVPILQTLNLVFGLLCLAWEWPLYYVARSKHLGHQRIEFRLFFLPMCALLAALLYQGMNPALYYVVGMIIYFWAYSEGESICEEPWTLPRKAARVVKEA